jgi:multiple sugar transport system substrate-binding protein
MRTLSQRSVLRGSFALAAAGTLAKPHIANAVATTATVWWTQGFAEEEDIAFQKIVSAVTSGTVPDLFQNNPAEILALYAWDDKLVDVTDVVDTQREEYTETALLSANCYNSVARKRSLYGVPYLQAGLLNHIWQPLVERAGYKIDDIPKTWDARYDFFKDVQKRLRAKGERKLYGVGFTLSTVGVDTNNQFNAFVIAYGGRGIVTSDGKLHLDDPQVREAVIKALTYPTTAYKDGFVPPGAVKLERLRQQQRLPFQAGRHGYRRHDLDRGRDHQEPKRLR